MFPQYATGEGIRDARNRHGGAVERRQCEICVDMVPVDNHGRYTYAASGQTTLYPTSGAGDLCVYDCEPVYMHYGPGTCTVAEEEASGSATRIWASASGMSNQVDYAAVGVANGTADPTRVSKQNHLVSIQVDGLVHTPSNSNFTFLPNDMVFAELDEHTEGDLGNRKRIRPVLVPGTLCSRAFASPLEDTHAVVESVLQVLKAIPNLDGVLEHIGAQLRDTFENFEDFPVLDDEKKAKAALLRLKVEVDGFITKAETGTLPNRAAPGFNVQHLSPALRKFNPAYSTALYYFIGRMLQVTRHIAGAHEPSPAYLHFLFTLFQQCTLVHLSLALILINERRKKCLGKSVNYCPPHGNLTLLLGSAF